MSKKYQRLKRQISNDNGITWNDMGNVYKVGNEMGGAGCTPRIYRTVQADPSIFECDGGNKYYVNEVQYSDNNGLTWITEYQTRGKIMEELSEDCGVAYRWVDVDGEWICEESNTTLSFEFTGNSLTYKINGLSFTATTSPYTVDVYADLGIEEIVNLASMFEYQPLTNIIQFPDTSNVTSMSRMFQGCTGLTSLDLSNFNTSNVTSMSWMFAFCNNLTSLDLSSFDTSNLPGAAWMFQGCGGLTSLDLSGWDTSNFTSMYGMFAGCGSLTSLDLSHFDTSNVTNMEKMFQNCSGLRILDLSSWSCANISNVESMFYMSSSLQQIILPNDFGANGLLQNLYLTFYGCSSLISMDLSMVSVTNFYGTNKFPMDNTFYKCGSLVSVNLDNWQCTYNNGGIFNDTFDYCNSLTTIYARNVNQELLNNLENTIDGDNEPGNVTIITS